MCSIVCIFIGQNQTLNKSVKILIILYFNHVIYIMNHCKFVRIAKCWCKMCNIIYNLMAYKLLIDSITKIIIWRGVHVKLVREICCKSIRLYYIILV